MFKNILHLEFHISPFMIKVVQSNNLFVKRPAYTILFRFDLITTFKIKPLRVFTENIYIHEHVPSLKSFTSCFPVIIFPRHSNMWKTKIYFLIVVP